MSINAAEISELIKKKIEQLDLDTEARTEGTVVGLADGVARIHGLGDVMQGEMIEFPNNIYGLALNLERDSVGAVILGAMNGYRKATPLNAPAVSWRCRPVRPCSDGW